VFPSEPKINTQEIEASVPIDSLDTQARSAVDQLVYDEQQKQQGLPTSKQQVCYRLIASHNRSFLGKHCG